MTLTIGIITSLIIVSEFTTITELWHILAGYIMCPCDLDHWPIFHKIWLRDPEVVMNMFAYFEVYRRFRFW